MHLVGLYGKARSGKDTVGEYLEESYAFYQTAFANAAKHILKKLYDLSDAQLWGDELKEVVDERYGFSPRYIMQYWLQACRHIEPNIWIRKCKEEAVSAMHRGFNVIITDTRFKGEAEMIKAYGGLLIKVERDGAKASGGIKGHISENDLNDWTQWDFIIDNNGTMQELFYQVDSIMRKLNVRRYK